MKRFRPATGIVLVLVFSALLLLAMHAARGGFRQASYERVAPDRNGVVRLPVADLGAEQVRFYRFLNAANQEVKFLVGRDAAGTVQVAFDANELCYKLKRGYRFEDGWLVCNKCDKSFRLEETNAGGGGCTPVPLAHRVDDGELVLAESDILKGWRFFR